jgi:predicted nucleic acid-binding protein
MILVDTSVWIDFLRQGDSLLSDLLSAGEVLVHPFVIGELRLGNIPKRKHFLSLLENLPQGNLATNDEVTHLIESHKLHGKGIGFTDAHILASSMIDEVPFWTKYKRLHAISTKLKGTNQSI